MGWDVFSLTVQTVDNEERVLINDLNMFAGEQDQVNRIANYGTVQAAECDE